MCVHLLLLRCVTTLPETDHCVGTCGQGRDIDAIAVGDIIYYMSNGGIYARRIMC